MNWTFIQITWTLMRRGSCWLGRWVLSIQQWGHWEKADGWDWYTHDFQLKITVIMWGHINSEVFVWRWIIRTRNTRLNTCYGTNFKTTKLSRPFYKPKEHSLSPAFSIVGSSWLRISSISLRRQVKVKRNKRNKKDKNLSSYQMPRVTMTE